MNGAIIVNKEKGFTSRDVINKLNKLFNTKKIGHTGTLDPMATGVLVCLMGKYTKLVPLITNEDKEYIAEIKLGILTDTLDITGRILKEDKVPHLDEKYIDSVLQSFKGYYKEEVPLYSATHVNGKRLYEYAREGKEVILPTKEVFIKEIELLFYNEDIIKFRVVVSKGTYIRSLIQSVCEKLNVVGTMSSLIRTRQGKFKLDDAYLLKDIEENNFKILNITELLDVKIKKLDNDLEKLVLNGHKLEMNIDGYVLFIKENQERALYYFENQMGVLKILF